MALRNSNYCWEQWNAGKDVSALVSHTAQVGEIPLLWLEPAVPQISRCLVIWLAGFSGDKESMRPYLADLAQAGFVALSFDPHLHGARMTGTQEQLRERVRGNIRRWFWPILYQTACDVSTVLDWCTDHLQVSPACGLGGISMGGDIAVAAAGLDQRIVAVSAGIATPDWMRPGSFEPPGRPDNQAWIAYNAGNPLTHLERYRHCPALDFECGAEDQQVPAAGATRFAALLADTYVQTPERMQVNLYPDIPHRYTDDMWRNALSWFQTFLAD